jgi:hypothetical protein
MAIDKKKAIFFAGGKRVHLQTNDNAKGLRFERDANGNWKATIELFIVKEEAQNVIRKFADFSNGEEEVTEDQLDKKFANQVFLAAFEDDGRPMNIEMDSAHLSVLFSKEDSGELVLVMRPVAMGKTENVKTENTIVAAGT